MNKSILIILLTLILTNFLGIFTIKNTLLLGMVIPFVFIEFNKSSHFKKPITFLLIGLFLSMISCQIFRGQSIFYTFRGSSNILYILFYFLLKYMKPTIKEVENALFWLAITFCVSYIIQYIMFPTVIFRGATDINENTDDLRIRIGAMGLSSLGYMYGLNKLLTPNKMKKKAFLLTGLCFIAIFLMGFRSMLAGILVFTIIMIVRIHGFHWKMVLATGLFIVLFIASLQIHEISKKIDSMITRNETQNLGNSDYIRIIQYDYFMNNHFSNSIEYFLGSGLPFDGTEYYKKMTKLTDIGIYWVDWGLLGLSWIIGIPAVLAMIIYSIKAYRLKVSQDHYYLGVWFLYLLTISAFTMEFYRNGNFVVQALVLYQVENVFLTQKCKTLGQKFTTKQLSFIYRKAIKI